MYGMNYGGGENRTHGQVEQAPRIDSFEAGAVHHWGTIFAYGGGQMIPLECDHFMDDEREVVELSRGDTLELVRTANHFGGSRAYWLCPRCGRRCRYLYFKNHRFQCRECAKLNYRCQQRTNDSTNYARDGLKLAREKLGWEPPFDICPAEFPYVTPDKPKGMHWATYRRYLARYQRYQKKYQDESMREMMSILGWH